MKNSILLLFVITIVGIQSAFGQGVNSITMYPNNPSANDTIIIVSDFSYFGNCSAGLLQAQINQFDSVINILPEYCGYGDSTLCNAIDSFIFNPLPLGNYSVNIEYHQGTVCGGGFDAIIANVDTSFQIGTVSTGLKNSNDIEISIFPNPVVEFITLDTKETIKEVNLFDMTGKISKFVFDGKYLDMRLMAPGLYILEIEMNNGQIVTKKIVKNTP